MLDKARTPLIVPKAAAGASANTTEEAAPYPSFFQGLSAASKSAYQGHQIARKISAPTPSGGRKLTKKTWGEFIWPIHKALFVGRAYFPSDNPSRYPALAGHQR